MNVWKSLLGMFRFSGWNCFKNYEKVEEGSVKILITLPSLMIASSMKRVWW